MEKVNTFIREVNLKLCRKLRTIPLSEAGKRFVIDSNAAIFDAINEDTHANQWGVSIIKNHGKYTITYWKNVWDEQTEEDIIIEKVRVTSDYRKVITIINSAVGANYEWGGYDAFWFKDKHLNTLKWYVLRDSSELYDDEEEIDCGELPEGFEKLEPVPETLSID